MKNTIWREKNKHTDIEQRPGPKGTRKRRYEFGKPLEDPKKEETEGRE